jgi:arylsulfatase A-like enzyme
VTADHGEAFGEHGMYKHAFELWDVLTHVPLLIQVPGAAHRVIDERRSDIDVAPTIANLMGVPVPAQFAGRSLVPELFGGAPQSHEPVVLDLPEDTNNPPRRAVLQGDYKLVVWGKGEHYQLFNLAQDAAEAQDLSAKEPAKLAELRTLFESTWQKIPQVEPFGGAKLKSGKSANGPTGPKP